MNTCREIINRIRTTLEPLYDAHEARQIALVYLSERLDESISRLLCDMGRTVEIEGLEQHLSELAEGRPLQYVIGSTEFCDLRIGVREGVLIPRPETEELVRRVVAEHPEAQHLLDVGTGSGCIALALKSLLPHAKLFAADISEAALTIARENAEKLTLDVDFRHADALSDLTEVFTEPFDVIVSNPPYIPDAERTQMRRNVTCYEPDNALFVPDQDPLRFYRAIARAARSLLREKGGLYFEIHEHFGQQVCDMLRTEGFDQITLHNDFNDKPRMVCCRKKT